MKRPDTVVLDADGALFDVHSSSTRDVAGAASSSWHASWFNRAGRPGEYPWTAAANVPDLGQALRHIVGESSVAGTGNTRRGADG